MHRILRFQSSAGINIVSAVLTRSGAVVDVGIYKKLWSLQAYCSSPFLIYTKDHWSTFSKVIPCLTPANRAVHDRCSGGVRQLQAGRSGRGGAHGQRGGRRAGRVLRQVPDQPESAAAAAGRQPVPKTSKLIPMAVPLHCRYWCNF
jgi:hypothetical protein